MRRNNPWLHSVRLRSTGGDYLEGMRIGRILRRYLTYVQAPLKVKGGTVPWDLPDVRGNTICEDANCVCASSCGLIWLGGVWRWGNPGFHRPTSAELGALSPGEAAAIYRRIFEELASYASEVEIPAFVIDYIRSTNSDSIRWLTHDEVDELEYPLSIAEWLAARCGRMSQNEKSLFDRLWAKSHSTDFTSDERASLTRLQGRQNQLSKCALSNIYQERAKIQ